MKLNVVLTIVIVLAVLSSLVGCQGVQTPLYQTPVPIQAVAQQVSSIQSQLLPAVSATTGKPVVVSPQTQTAISAATTLASNPAPTAQDIATAVAPLIPTPYKDYMALGLVALTIIGQVLTQIRASNNHKEVLQTAITTPGTTSSKP